MDEEVRAEHNWDLRDNRVNDTEAGDRLRASEATNECRVKVSQLLFRNCVQANNDCLEIPRLPHLNLYLNKAALNNRGNPSCFLQKDSLDILCFKCLKT